VKLKLQSIVRIWLTFTSVCVLCGTVSAQRTTFHLKDGDKISGLVLSEGAKSVAVSNAWAKAISIPLSAISKRETNNLAQVPSSAPPIVKLDTPTPAKLEPETAAKSAAKLDPKPKGKLSGQVRVGLDLIFNATDQQNYIGDFKLAYERPYRANPKKNFRNTSQVDGQYQTTDSQESANRAQGSNKSDFDFATKCYAYGLIGAGYNVIQKIDFAYQVGPGIGYHLVQQPSFLLNVEGGISHAVEHRRDTDDIEKAFFRLGADSTWNILKNLKLTSSLAFYTDIVNEGEYYSEFASNLSYGFWKNLTLNLTAIDNYNTDVAPGVDQNRFEIRSSVGVSF
jgi:putative salt-induced outer membrane protein YdiY